MAMLKRDVKGLVKRILDKEDKINSRIEEVEGKIMEYEDEIKIKYDEMIDNEMDENEKGRLACEKDIKKYNEKITDQRNLLEGYKRKAEDLTVSGEELSKIKEACLKEIEKTKNEYDKKTNEIEEVEKKAREQAKKTKQVIDKLKIERENISNLHYTEPIKIAKYIHPLAAKLSRDEKKGFISSWIHDIDLNQHFRDLKGEDSRWMKKREVSYTDHELFDLMEQIKNEEAVGIYRDQDGEIIGSKKSSMPQYKRNVEDKCVEKEERILHLATKNLERKRLK